MKNLTFITLMMFFAISISHAQNIIPASSVSQYIGKFKKVYGYEYERRLVKVKGQRDSVLRLIYLSDSTLKKRQLIVIITDKADPNHQLTGTISHEKILKDRMPLRAQANGKIILFNGKTAIVVDDPDNYMMFIKVN